jgi:tetratricopeptide (TPR) repeat protein/TolB-like protein
VNSRPALRLRTLGELRLSSTDGELLPGRRKELALLAYLARRAPRVVRRDELIGLLWDERDEVHARQSLRQALLRLRRAVGDGLVVTRESAQLLDGVVELDSRAFETESREGRAADAIQRWDGDFLLGAEDAGGEAYRNWVEGERATLRRLLSASYEQLLVAAAEAGDRNVAATMAERWRDLFPDDEPPAVLQRLRQQGGLEIHTVPTTADTPGSAALFTPDLVGRDAARRELATAWRTVLSGGSETVVVEGSEGMGKTLLCDRFLDTLPLRGESLGALVLRARAREERAGVPWECAREMLSALSRAPGLGGASSGALAESCRLIPTLAERFTGLAQPSGDDRTLRGAVTELLAVVAEELPVVIFVDDLVYADAESQEFVLALARHLPSRILLLVTARPESHSPSAPLAELWQRPGVRRLVLRPLNEEEIVTLVHSMVALQEKDARTLAGRLHADTGGNPFFVAETVSAMVDEGHLTPDARGIWRLTDALAGQSLPLSSGARDAVGRRFTRLRTDAQRLAAAAATVKEPMALDVLGAESGLAPDRFDAALDELIVRHLLRPVRSSTGQPNTFEFAHPLIRRFARDQLLLARSPHGGRQSRRWWRNPRRVIATAVAVAAVGVVGAKTLRPLAAGWGPFAPPVIAVGSIEPLGGADTLGVTGAIGDMLATNLARVPELRVVSTARMYEVMAQSRTKSDEPAAWVAAARGAGAGELLEGGIHHAPNGLRLDLRRVDLRSGAVLAAYTVEGTNAFDLVDRATSQVAAAFGRPVGDLPVRDVTTQSVVAYRFYEEGLRSFAMADYRSARRLFDAAVTEDSGFAMAAHYASLTRLEQHEPVLLATQQRLMRLADRASDRDRLLMRGAWLELATAPEIVAVAETLAIRYPTEPDGHYLLGMARVNSGDAIGALPHFRRVVAMDSLGLRGSQPRCRACDAFSQIVRSYQFADSAAAAERVAREWLRLQPQSARPWQALAGVLEMQSHFEEALAAHRSAVSISPGHPYDALQPARVRIQMGDYAEADDRLRELARDGARNVQVDALWFLTISLREQGRLREALETITSMERLGPWGSAGPQLRAQILLEMGRPADAAVVFDSVARASYPGAPGQLARHRSWNLTHFASALAAAGDTGRLTALADTLQRWGQLSAYGRDWRLHHHVRGLLLVTRGDLEEAAAEFRRAMYSPTLGYTRTNLELAEVLLRLQRPNEAVVLLQAALRGGVEGSSLYVTRTELHEALGRAWEAAGRPDSAAVQHTYVVKAWRTADSQFYARRDSVRMRLTADERVRRGGTGRG